jgi:hypothetical protein
MTVENQAKLCIYCRRMLDPLEFSLEHVIPQFLGGAYAPQTLKTRDVCRKCNSNLGLFVDAGFEKDWAVSQRLSLIAHRTYDPQADIGLPLICMGISQIPLPGIEPEEVCESWLGPAGEQIYWVRPADERMYWYMGGNPVTAKTARTTAYFMFSVRSHLDPLRTMRSFRDAFTDRKVKKVLCTTLVDGDPSSMGFSAPDELDVQRTQFLQQYCSEHPQRNLGISMYTKYDIRFLSKLALGVAHCVFGERALRTPYAEELYRGLYLRPDDEMPGIEVLTNLEREKNPLFDRLMGSEECVTLALLASPEGVRLNLNIGGSMNWIIKCADLDGLRKADLETIGIGRVVTLSRQRRLCADTSLQEYVAHKGGNIRHPDLDQILSTVAGSRDNEGASPSRQGA